MIYTAQQLRQIAANVEAVRIMQQLIQAALDGQISWRQEVGMKPEYGQRLQAKLQALGYTVTVHGQREDELEGTLFDVEISWQ